MPLIDRARYRALFEPLAGRRIGFLQLPGNHGDSMIYIATRQMLALWEIEYRELMVEEEILSGRLTEPVDEILIGGGGSLGATYSRNLDLRRRALALGPPVTVLPQTIVDPGEDLSRYRRVYVRDAVSAARHPGFDLFPDLALGLEWRAQTRTLPGTAVYLRRDRERGLPEHPASLGDPVELCADMAAYIDLAGHHEHLVTDRLHFAIAGLMHGVRVTLLPCSYFKNRSMYDTWLAGLGCGWLDEVPA